jgi:hypothetical protein
MIIANSLYYLVLSLKKSTYSHIFSTIFRKIQFWWLRTDPLKMTLNISYLESLPSQTEKTLSIFNIKNKDFLIFSYKIRYFLPFVRFY